MLLVTVTETVTPVPAMFTDTVVAVGASTFCAAAVLPDTVAVAAVSWPAIAAVAAGRLPVSAVVPAWLAATFVTFVPWDRNHTLNVPLAARISTNCLVASTTRPRSNASLTRPCHISVSLRVLASLENCVNARACDHE